MGLFSEDSKLKFKLIPSTPEQDQARSYLVDLMNTNVEYPTEQIAPLTGTERQIQRQLPSYLNQIASDFDASRGYYNDVLGGNYDPRTSDFYRGFREEAESLKADSIQDIRRSAQKGGGTTRSTPTYAAIGETSKEFNDRILQQLGGMYETERGRMGQAAGDLSRLGGQYASNLSQVEQLAFVKRQQEQAKLSAFYQAAMQTLLAPYQYNAQIAGALLGEQRYAGYTTGGGLTDLGFMVSAASNAIGGGGWPSFGGGQQQVSAGGQGTGGYHQY